jgi:hypothetical protein
LTVYRRFNWRSDRPRPVEVIDEVASQPLVVVMPKCTGSTSRYRAWAVFERIVAYYDARVTWPEKF